MVARLSCAAPCNTESLAHSKAGVSMVGMVSSGYGDSSDQWHLKVSFSNLHDRNQEKEKASVPSRCSPQRIQGWRQASFQIDYGRPAGSSPRMSASTV